MTNVLRTALWVLTVLCLGSSTAFAADVISGPSDPIGFTFFTGYMAMFAASVFFFFERGRVADKWKTSLLISGLITMIAAVHYYYMRDFYIANGTSPTAYRYIDWTLTVPLMCVEFYMLLRPAGASVAMMWRLIASSVLMLVAGYLGEVGTPPTGPVPQIMGMGINVFWGVISTIGWAGIIYEIFMGEGKKVAAASGNATVQAAFKQLSMFALIGWAIYPIGYMLLPGNLLAGIAPPSSMDLIYNIGDAVNKIGFGLVVYAMAIKDTK